jgi:serine/threonine protein kinase HipA of HipAB toxin-antitoxin module
MRTFMVRWALLQLLIGNSDAHGKNLSFFMNSAGLVLAPLYELVSINVYLSCLVRPSKLDIPQSWEAGVSNGRRVR